MVYVKVILDTRKEKATKIYTVKIRVTYNRQQKYYLTGFKMTAEEFAETFKKTPPKRLEEIRIQLDHLELKAKRIISKLEGFSFKSFEEKFFQNNNAGKSIFDLYEEVIKEKMEGGNISTAINYRCSMRSIQAFQPKLAFIDVTPKFLQQYEKHLLADKKSISTVGIYIRPLRAIINEAKSRKILPEGFYPFGPKKYIIPESRNIKKALDKEDFKKIVQYVPEEEMGFEARAKDFWLLSYLCQGMNPKDLLLLKKENIEGKFIKFIREKTKNTIRSGITEISVPILPEMEAIINKWKTDEDDSPYLFEFVNDEMSELDIYKVVQQFVKMTNKYINVIAAKVGVTKRVTCYTARFQFTKVMVDANVSLEYLRQCLGHQKFTTTQRYIGSFEDLKKQDIASKYLLNFN